MEEHTQFTRFYQDFKQRYIPLFISWIIFLWDSPFLMGFLFWHGFPTCFKPFRTPFQGNSRSYRPHRGNSRSYRPQTLLQTSASLSKATLAATGPSHLFLRAFKTAICPPSDRYRPQPFVFKGVQDCRLPASNPSNPSNPPAGLSKATLAATGPSHLFLRAFNCHLPAFKPLQAPAICF